MSPKGVGLLLRRCHVVNVVGEVEEEIMISMIFGILSSKKEQISDQEGKALPMMTCIMMPMMIDMDCLIRNGTAANKTAPPSYLLKICCVVIERVLSSSADACIVIVRYFMGPGASRAPSIDGTGCPSFF